MNRQGPPQKQLVVGPESRPFREKDLLPSRREGVGRGNSPQGQKVQREVFLSPPPLSTVSGPITLWADLVDKGEIEFCQSVEEISFSPSLALFLLQVLAILAILYTAPLSP